MEPFLADFINNPKVPKIIRYTIVILSIGFIMYIGIMCGMNSPMIWGRVFGYTLTVVFLMVGIYLIRKISKK